MTKRIFLLLISSLVPIQCVRVHAQVLVIANSSVSATNVSRTQLRDVFTGATSSLAGGAQVTPVLLKQGWVHEEFLGLYIDKSDSGFRAGWRSILFSGQGAMPRTLDSEKAMVEYVAHTAGAIGYIGKAAPHEGVKILDVR
jgi:ABC-type phosphate transport system substrate-binding protein